VSIEAHTAAAAIESDLRAAGSAERAAGEKRYLKVRRSSADFGRFAAYADGMLDEREFFIRKAIGWVLREVGKRDPETVYEWLMPRINRTSGVTVREAVKHLTPAQREALMTAYQTRRGRPAGRPRQSDASGSS